MTLFWIFAAILSLLAAGFVYWPLRKAGAPGRSLAEDRTGLVLDLFNEHKHQLEAQLQAGEIDAAQYEQLKQELELSLLQDAAAGDSQPDDGARQVRYTGFIVVFALLVPLAALTFYWYKGNLEDLEIRQLQRDYMHQMAMPEGAEATRNDTLDELITRLEARLEREPGNDGNRYLLARSYMQRGDYLDAVRHYSHLLQDGDPPAHIVAELAQAIFLAAGHQITAEVDMLARRALQLDPNESTALGLMGIGAFQQQNYRDAIDYWQRAVAQIGPSSPGGQSLVFGIERAKSLLQESGEGESTAATDAKQAAAQASIAIQVSLADSVKAAPEDTVFVYARAWQGARMPLAITRLRVSDLPREVVLDESMSMAPGMSITTVPQLELVARVSASGSPTAASGDWQATLGPLSLNQIDRPLTLEITRQIP